MSDKKYDIAIIGGGIIGNAIARELSRYNLKTILIEKEIEVCFGTSKANSGIIHSGIHDTKDKLKGRLCFEGNKLWGKLSKELRIPFKRVGEILVAKKDDDMRVLKELLENAKANNITAELVGENKLRKLEPNLAPNIKAGLLAPTAGVIPPYEMTYALYENAIQNGVEYLLESEVTGITKKDNGFTIKAGSKEINSTYIVNAAGVYADKVASFAGAANFSIKPRKGEEYLLDKRYNSINKHIIFPTPTLSSKGILIIKTIENSTMIGPTAEDVSDKEDKRTSEAGLEKVLKHVKTMIPDISRKDIIASFAGIRPISNTNDFIIEESKNVSHFINVAGIQSPGLTAAPAIAVMVSDILKKAGLKLNKKRKFKKYDRPHRRMAYLINRSKEIMIKLDKSYGNVVCRCETVTEGEIVAAIKNGARTVDGVKFRTRAGMGRCQAGFCIHHVVKILSRELGIPEEEITKRGKGTEILKEKR